MFDSGVGGLTVLRELIRFLPGEDFIYFGDTARVPYGGRSPETVIRYSREDARFLQDQGVKMVVVACNTSSAIALPALADNFPLPIIGVVEPGARAAARATRIGRIGVIGTEATIRSQAYDKVIRSLNPEVRVRSVACPLFVPLVEEGWVRDTIVRSIVQRYLARFNTKLLNSTGIDVLLLGCTHYPLLKGVIRDVMRKKVRLIDSAVETARGVRQLLRETDLARKRVSGGKIKFFSSDDPDKFQRLGQKFLGRSITRVKRVQVG